MTISYSTLFVPTVLTTAAAILLTVAASPTTTILRGCRVRIVNKTASARTVTLYAVPSGDTVTDNEFCSNKSIAPYDYLDVDVTMIGAGGTLQALADANSALIVSALSGAYFS